MSFLGPSAERLPGCRWLRIEREDSIRSQPEATRHCNYSLANRLIQSLGIWESQLGQPTSGLLPIGPVPRSSLHDGPVLNECDSILEHQVASEVGEQSEVGCGQPSYIVVRKLSTSRSLPDRPLGSILLPRVMPSAAIKAKCGAQETGRPLHLGRQTWRYELSITDKLVDDDS